MPSSSRYSLASMYNLLHFPDRTAGFALRVIINSARKVALCCYLLYGDRWGAE